MSRRCTYLEKATLDEYGTVGVDEAGLIEANGGEEAESLVADDAEEGNGVDERAEEEGNIGGVDPNSVVTHCLAHCAQEHVLALLHDGRPTTEVVLQHGRHRRAVRLRRRRGLRFRRRRLRRRWRGCGRCLRCIHGKHCATGALAHVHYRVTGTAAKGGHCLS